MNNNANEGWGDPGDETATLAAPPETAWPADGTTVEVAGDPDENQSALYERLAVTEDRLRDHDVIGAIRLARVAAADEPSFVRIVDQLLTYAPDTHPRAIAPTKLLVQAITDTEARFTVPPVA